MAALAKACLQLRQLVLSWAWSISDDGLHELLPLCRALEVLILTGARRLRGTFLCAIPACLPRLRVRLRFPFLRVAKSYCILPLCHPVSCST